MFEFFVHYALGNIPDWLWPALAGGAFVVWFFAGVISHLPQFALYAKLIKPVAFIAMLMGVFMYGGAGVIAVYKADLVEAQHQAELAAEKAKAEAKAKAAAEAKAKADAEAKAKAAAAAAAAPVGAPPVPTTPPPASPNK